MFKSATLRLTGWYLLILMIMSLGFSIVIYQVASGEVQNRFERFETILQDDYRNFMPVNGSAALRLAEQQEANANMSVGLLYINLAVFLAGGLGSYFLARRNLLPIEQAHEAQSRFTSDASHELRTPLAVMKTELEVALMDKNATNEELREVIKSSLEEVDKLSKISEMLLNLSRSDHSKINTGPVDLYETTIDTIKAFGQSSDRVKVKSDKKIIVQGNDTSISELIKVLIENALLYSPKSSVINISLSKKGQHAKFKITNSGPGISPEKLPHIFDRFFRADSSRTSGPQKGHGLGLALAKRIVELHDGELSVASIEGQETTFIFRLPTKQKSQANPKD